MSISRILILTLYIFCVVAFAGCGGGGGGSNNTTGNTAGNTTVGTTFQTAYDTCYKGTPMLYDVAYCTAYANAIVAGSSAADANISGAVAAGSNVGNIGTGQAITSVGTPLPGAATNVTSFQTAYDTCYNGTPRLYTVAYCTAYANAIVAGNSPAVANIAGATAAGSNVGNIGMGQTITSVGTPLSSGSVGVPTVTGIDLNSGVPGTTVTIYGTNFIANSASNTVRFNGVQATVVGATNTKIKAMIPSGATSGTISVTTAYGTATGVDVFYVQ